MKVTAILVTLMMIPAALVMSEGIRGDPSQTDKPDEAVRELSSDSLTDTNHRALTPKKWVIPTQTSTGGSDSTYWPSSFNGYPGLTEFHFRFLNGPHAIRRIRVRPTDTQAQVSFNDKNSDDDYRWQLGATNLPQGQDMTIYRIAQGSNARGCTTVNGEPWVENYVPVLRGFDLEFNQSSGTNRPLNQVKVNVFKNGHSASVTVCFNDDDNDDMFRWKVWYALVHESKTYSKHTYDTGTQYDGGGQDSVGAVEASRYRQVLSGFDLRFKGADARHIDRIGVDLGSDIIVKFGKFHVLVDQSATRSAWAIYS